MNSPVTVLLSDMNGKTIIVKTFETSSNHQIHLNISSMPQGSYFVVVKANEFQLTRKVVVMHEQHQVILIQEFVKTANGSQSI
jgi:hypothetical protein